MGWPSVLMAHCGNHGLALVAIALVGGCKDAEPLGRPSPPDLQLVTAGAEPRRVLRYHPEPGTTRKLEISVALELTADGMGAPMPTLVLDVSARVDALLPDGSVTLRTTIDDVKAREVENSTVSAASVAGPLEKLEGLAIYAVLAPNGRLLGTKLDAGQRVLPPELDQQIKSLLANFEATMMPLPDEAIGVGAIWRNSRALGQNGLALTAVNTVTLVSLQNDVVGYTLDTDIHGADQSARQGDVMIDVKDLVGNGMGKGTIDLGRLDITSELGAELRSLMSAPGDPTPTKMEMATLLRVRPL